MSPRSRTRCVRPAALTGGLWLAACLVAGYFAMAYEFQGGALGLVPSAWPSDSRMLRDTKSDTVVAFLHPRCVCSRATTAQLVRTLEAHPGATLLVPVFVPSQPGDITPWMENDMVRMIRTTLPQATIVPDPGGVEAKRFGALTSGTILVYDARGRRVFQGGITDRRGGEGQNPGLRRLAQILDGVRGPAERESSPVFGCPIIAQGGR